MRDITIFLVLVIPLCAAVKLYDYVKSRERLRCPVCQGVSIGTNIGGRPDDNLCDQHYRSVWHRITYTDADSAEKP